MRIKEKLWYWYVKLREEENLNEIFCNIKERKGTALFIDRDLTLQEKTVTRKLITIKTNILKLDRSGELLLGKCVCRYVGDSEFSLKNGLLRCGEQDSVELLNRIFGYEFGNINA